MERLEQTLWERQSRALQGDAAGEALEQQRERAEKAAREAARAREEMAQLKSRMLSEQLDYQRLQVRRRACVCRGRGGGGGTRPWWLALLACGGAHWPLATAHSDPPWPRTCFGCVNGAPG